MCLTVSGAQGDVIVPSWGWEKEWMEGVQWRRVVVSTHYR